MRENISIEKAVDRLLDITDPAGLTLVPLFNAVGHVLSEDILADQFVPRFDRSAMDGYAVKARDTKDSSTGNPVFLTILKQNDPANGIPFSIGPQTCTKISTGDPIPKGADAVIKYEDTKKHEDGILIQSPLGQGANIVYRGEDMKPGDFIARRGSMINAPLAAVFAGLGKSLVPVYAPVKVAFLSTGGELLDPSEEVHPGKVFDSNMYGLSARCHELDAEPIKLGIASDDAETVSRYIHTGLELADLLVTTGGISIDESDVVVEALRQTGAKILFQGVAMKPGSPTMAACKDGKIIIGLSGNPAGAMISFELIVVPLIKHLRGLASVLPIKFRGFFADRFEKESPQRRLLRGKIVWQEEQCCVKLTGSQGNVALTSLIDCNALVDVPAGSGPILYGQKVSGFLFGGNKLDATWLNTESTEDQGSEKIESSKVLEMSPL